MSQSKSFWDHPVETIEEALSIKKQIASLQAKLGSIFGGDSSPAADASPGRKAGGKRTFSEASRKKMAAAQRARWANRGGETASAGNTSSAPKKRGRKPMSPEARARIAEAQRARWAKSKGTDSSSGSASAAQAKSSASKSGGKKGKKRTMSPEGRARIAEAARRRWAKLKGA